MEQIALVARVQYSEHASNGCCKMHVQAKQNTLIAIKLCKLIQVRPKATVLTVESKAANFNFKTIKT